MFDELKPCPFCGEKPNLYANEGVKVKCPSCGAQTVIMRDREKYFGMEVSNNSIGAVIDLWNKRV